VDGANFRRTLFIVQNKPAKLDLKRREITTGVWALPCMIAEEEGLLAVIPRGVCQLIDAKLAPLVFLFASSPHSNEAFGAARQKRRKPG
jgi:hypothetical protein